MNRIIISLCVAALAGGGALQAQDNINPRGRMMLMRSEKGLASRSGEQEILATVKLKSATTSTEGIEAAGGRVMNRFGEFAIVSMPLKAAREVAAARGVSSLSFGEEARPLLYKARADAKVDNVHRGLIKLDDGSKAPTLNGKGVVAGIFDQGFDFGHVNFSSTDGLRIKEYVKIGFEKDEEGNAVPTTTIYDTPAAIVKESTDLMSATHGTHVAGILSGSYQGKGTAWQVTEDDNPIKTKNTRKIPFYGVAPGTDIVMGAGSMSTSAILLGISEFITYATEEGKPLVVNLSLGHNTGFHDPNEPISQALDQLGMNSVIMIAAGNEGNYDMCLRHTSTDDKPSVKSFFDLPSGDELNDAVYIVTPTNSEVNCRVVLYDTSTGTELQAINLMDDRYAGFADNSISDEDLTHNDAYNGAFAGALYGFKGFDEEVGKYFAYLQMEDLKARKANGSVRLGIEVSGKTGTEIFVYGSKDAPFVSGGVTGWMNGTSDGSINAMACGKNVIPVGSYTTGRYFVSSNGENISYYPSFVLNGISAFSSYGTLTDGRTLPLIAAPGAAVISSLSGPYLSSHSAEIAGAQATATDDNGKTHYWGEESGTSMATPFAAGVVALMLEADPTLTTAEVADILTKSARNDKMTALSPKRWGAGKIDAEGAVKLTLARKSSGISGTVADSAPEVMVSPNGSSWEAFAAGARGVTVTLTDMSGRRVSSAATTGESATIATEGLSRGVYVLEACTADGRRTTRKISL